MDVYKKIIILYSGQKLAERLLKDISNQEFGRLTALYRLDIKDKTKRLLLALSL